MSMPCADLVDRDCDAANFSYVYNIKFTPNRFKKIFQGKSEEYFEDQVSTPSLGHTIKIA